MVTLAVSAEEFGVVDQIQQVRMNSFGVEQFGGCA
jgi:hypothetical protein